MEKLLAIIFICLFPFTSMSQVLTKYPLEFGDVFVLRVKIMKNVFSAKCPCEQKNKCTIYQVDSAKIIYNSSGTNYDSLMVSSMRYLLIKDKDINNLKLSNMLLITAMPTGSTHYLALSRVLNNIDTDAFEFYHPYAYLTMLSPCKKEDKFEKYIIKH